jgi:hypothetical protein
MAWRPSAAAEQFQMVTAANLICLNLYQTDSNTCSSMLYPHALNQLHNFYRLSTSSTVRHRVSEFLQAASSYNVQICIVRWLAHSSSLQSYLFVIATMC